MASLTHHISTTQKPFEWRSLNRKWWCSRRRQMQQPPAFFRETLIVRLSAVLPSRRKKKGTFHGCRFRRIYSERGMLCLPHPLKTYMRRNLRLDTIVYMMTEFRMGFCIWYFLARISVTINPQATRLSTHALCLAGILLLQ